MNQYAITSKNVHKKYGRHTVLHDVSISVKQGDIYGLIGKNGSGKTTLFRILTGMIKEYRGVVSINENGAYKNNLSAVINTPSLFLNMSAYENMKAQSYLLGIRDSKKINQILETVGLSDCGNKAVKDFSLGMTQRLKLGLALLENPSILILDEPANGLDPDGILELRKLLIHLNRSNGLTILIASHILSELGQLVNCLGILHDGKIVREVSDIDILQDTNGLEKLYVEFTRGR